MLSKHHKNILYFAWEFIVFHLVYRITQYIICQSF